jgi:phosphatidylglycerophosphatase A
MPSNKVLAATNSAITMPGWKRFVAQALATWFGCGLVPKGPGTVGSIGAIVVLLPLLLNDVAAWRMVLASLFLVVLLPGIWAASRYEETTGRKDPQPVVVDEVLGQWLTLLFATKLTWASVGFGLLLFRVFDITKPFPVRHAERFRAGGGIVADDLVAGLYGGLVLFAAGWFNLY